MPPTDDEFTAQVRAAATGEPDWLAMESGHPTVIRQRLDLLPGLRAFEPDAVSATASRTGAQLFADFAHTICGAEIRDRAELDRTLMLLAMARDAYLEAVAAV